MVTDKLPQRAEIIGARLRQRLERIRVRNDLVGIADIRGPGAMIAFDIVKDRNGRDPDAETTKRVVQRAYENGPILLSCSINANPIRILVPFTANDETIDEGMAILEKTLAVQEPGVGVYL